MNYEENLHGNFMSIRVQDNKGETFYRTIDSINDNYVVYPSDRKKRKKKTLSIITKFKKRKINYRKNKKKINNLLDILKRISFASTDTD